jgi:hypothetical protein
MKFALAFLLLTATPLRVVAGDSGYSVKYDGGTLPGTNPGSDLKIYIERSQVRLVRGKKDVMIIPASAIAEISYGQDVHRRVRTAIAVGILSLGVAPLSAWGKSRKDFVGLTWADGDKKGGFAVRCDKNEYRGILAGLEGVTGKTAVNTDIRPSSESKITVQRGDAIQETTGGNEQPVNLLTNDSIVKLVKAGLSENTTISMVNNRPGKYSLSAEDVIALKQAGVSENIITAMMSRQAAGSARVAAAKPKDPTKQDQPSQAVTTSDTTNVAPKQARASEDIVTAVVNKQVPASVPVAATKPGDAMKQDQPPQAVTTSDRANVTPKQAGASENVVTAVVNNQAPASAPAEATKPGDAMKQDRPPRAVTTSDATGMAHKQEEAGTEKFSDVTTVESRTHSWLLGKGLLGDGALSFQYQCPEQATSCQPSEIGITFTRHGRDWILMHAPKEIIFSADGEPIRANDVKWDGHATSEGVEEFFTGTVSAEEFRLFIGSKDAEVKVGGTAGFTKAFTPTDLDDWRGFGRVVSTAK